MAIHKRCIGLAQSKKATFILLLSLAILAVMYGLIDITYIDRNRIITKYTIEMLRVNIIQGTKSDDISLSKATDCQPLHFAKSKLPITVLATFTGSGNTWLRHLIQQLSGVYTGSLLRDKRLIRVFPGEGRKDGTVLTISTHYPQIDNLTSITEPIEKVVVLIRRPFDAIRSTAYLRQRELNATQGPWLMMGTKKKWNKRVREELNVYRNFHLYWLNKANIKLHVIYFDNLRANLLSELQNLANFLNVTGVTEQLLFCIQENMEGHFHTIDKPQNDWMLYSYLYDYLKDSIPQAYAEVRAMVNRAYGRNGMTHNNTVNVSSEANTTVTSAQSTYPPANITERIEA